MLYLKGSDNPLNTYPVTYSRAPGISVQRALAEKLGTGLNTTKKLAKMKSLNPDIYGGVILDPGLSQKLKNRFMYSGIREDMLKDLKDLMNRKPKKIPIIKGSGKRRRKRMCGGKNILSRAIEKLRDKILGKKTPEPIYTPSLPPPQTPISQPISQPIPETTPEIDPNLLDYYDPTMEEPITESIPQPTTTTTAKTTLTAAERRRLRNKGGSIFTKKIKGIVPIWSLMSD